MSIELVVSEPRLRRAVIESLPSEVRLEAEVSFACFDMDRDFDWFEDDVRVALGRSDCRYVITTSDVREMAAGFLPLAMRDRYEPVDIFAGRSIGDGGCTRCSGADEGNHVHITYVVRRGYESTTSQRVKAWDALRYAELLDDTALVDRNARGLLLLLGGVDPGRVAAHLIGRLAMDTVTALPELSDEDRGLLALTFGALAACASEPFMRTSMEAFRNALAS